jgi:hypothetical protein
MSGCIRCNPGPIDLERGLPKQLIMKSLYTKEEWMAMAWQYNWAGQRQCTQKTVLTLLQ